MYTEKSVVKCESGLHNRQATYFVQKANEFESSIWLESGSRRMNAKSLLGIMSLGVVTGTTVTLGGGGIGYVLQPSFGFLLGLIPAAAVIGALTARRTGYLTVLAAVLVGDLILYAVGVPYMYLILHVYMQSAKTFPALLAAMLVYVPGDTLKIIVVTALAPVLRRTLVKAVPNL